MRRPADGIPPGVDPLLLGPRLRGPLLLGRGVLVGMVVLAGMGTACRSAPGAWRPDTGTRRPSATHLRVRGGVQERSLSCESRSAVDLLAHHGIPVAEARFLDGLPRSDNPDRGFVGSVDGPSGGLPPSGYGVHVGPVAERLRALGAEVRVLEGADLDALLDHVAAGEVVMVWATAGLDAPAPSRMRDARGRPFTAVPFEHTYLLVGYDPGRVELLDPGTGEARMASAARFDASWAALGRQALVVLGPAR